MATNYTLKLDADADKILHLQPDPENIIWPEKPEVIK